MHDDPVDTVTPGGPAAPLGARGDAARLEARAGAAGRREPALVTRPAALVVVLLVALAEYAALAADIVHGCAVSELDGDVAAWVARSMPDWAEWLARPFTWLGGDLATTVLVVVALVLLLRRGERSNAVLLAVVAVGSHLLVQTAKNGYERARPDAGSAIELPASYSFPSGHATTGVAVYGLLGLLLAAHARTQSRRDAAIVAGFALGALAGASRVVLNVHYVGDVLAGFCLGLSWLCVCLLVDHRLRR
jgi:undecaprenyl-diphosphatase